MTLPLPHEGVDICEKIVVARHSVVNWGTVLWEQVGQSCLQAQVSTLTTILE